MIEALAYYLTQKEKEEFEKLEKEKKLIAELKSLLLEEVKEDGGHS